MRSRPSSPRSFLKTSLSCHFPHNTTELEVEALQAAVKSAAAKRDAAKAVRRSLPPPPPPSSSSSSSSSPTHSNALSLLHLLTDL